MIARLTGTLVDSQGTRGVLDVRGVGYAVDAPQRTLEGWAGGEQVVAHISTQVREDAIQLFGFANTRDRDAFEALLRVKGVGPKLGLAILNALSVDTLSQAVAQSDLATLSRVPGVGKKSAQRLALELEGKLPAANFDPSATPRPQRAAPNDKLPLALARLGYTKSEIDRALAGLPSELGPDAEIGERLRASLALLSGG